MSIWLSIFLLGMAGPAAAQLAGSAVSVLDAGRTPRASFSTNERIIFQQRVSNGSASSSKIQFTFIVLDPLLKTVFTHSGNAVPGNVGNAASQIAGVKVSAFYSTPGVYKLTARATLDLQVVSQEATFTVSSPNILLIYPPNGAQNVADKPMIFRWSSSGAVKYRVTVGDNPSFFNSVFTGDTAGSVNSFTYPDNPSDARARLAAGTVYYWKVEGLDASGNKVAESAVPFNFSVESAPLTRDVAVTGLDILGRQGEKMTFKVTVLNQGGTSETNLPLKFSVGGLPAPGSPVQMPLLSPATAKEYTFEVEQPSDQGQSLAIGCIEFFDDNVANNCRSIQVTRVDKSESTDPIFNQRKLSDGEVWNAIAELLRDRGTDLSDYAIVGLDKQLTRDDLDALLAALRSGQANIEVTGPDEGNLLPDTGGLSAGGSSVPGLEVPDAPPEEAVPSIDRETTVPAPKLWTELKDRLKGLGVELEGFSITGFNPPLTEGGLEYLLAAIARGEVQVEVTGPTLGADIPYVVQVPEVLAEDEPPPPPAPEEEPPAEPGNADAGKEWAGLAQGVSNKSTYLNITSKNAWNKVWKRLGGKDAPEIDFKATMIVGVIAGKAQRADRVEIVSLKKRITGLHVMYRLVVHRRMISPMGANQAAVRSLVPYHLRAIPKTGLNLHFENIRENE